MFTFNNRTALVTGASRGIGKAVARILAQAGVKVCGTATTAAGASGIASELRALRSRGGVGLELDFNKENAADELFSALAERGAHPDILVNNAGIAVDALAVRMSTKDWDRTIRINLSSVYWLCKNALRGMMRNKWGRIINISSVVGLSGNPGQSGYAASKAGMIGFSKSLASEVASRGITVNCVAPGFVQTDMTDKIDTAKLLPRIPMGRLGRPEDAAAAVLFLASEESSYITGETINVNGGLYMT